MVVLAASAYRSQTVRRLLWQADRHDPKSNRYALVPDGTVHDFGWISAVYGRGIVEKLLHVAPVAFGDISPKSVPAYFEILRYFLIFVANNATETPTQDHYRSIFRSIADNGNIDGSHWRVIIDDFTDEILRNSRETFPKCKSPTTIANRVHSFNSLRKRLFAELGWPNPDHYGVAPARKRGGRRGLGELCQDFQQAPSGVHQANVERLALIRAGSERILQAELHKFNSWQNADSRIGSPDHEQYCKAIASGRFWKIFSRADVAKLDDDERLAIVLRYAEEFALKDHSILFTRLVRRLSPVPSSEILSYLEGRVGALIAANLIILIDSGINISVCDELKADPITRNAKAGKVEISTLSGVKNRAKYSEIDFHLKDNAVLSAIKGHNGLSGLAALQAWQRISKPVRVRAAELGDKAAGRLWLHQGARGHLFRVGFRHDEWWSFVKRLWEEVPQLNELRFTRANIRSTILQIQAIQNGGDAAAVAKIARHRSQTITLETYLNKPHIRTLLDEKINHFQSEFESIFGDVSSRANKIFLTEAEFARRRSSAVENGLGFYCSNPRLGYQNSEVGTMCSKIEACSGCPLLKFYPSSAAIVDLLWFEESLKRVQSEFATTNPERWMSVWMPALALVEAVKVLLADGRFRGRLREAESMIADAIAQGHPRYFLPW